uniref:Uncharacterized protein n=1 Tax=Lepeophtheirus salmonis TaxID=72036 RepID=A0A0K2UFL9_LEPSM
MQDHQKLKNVLFLKNRYFLGGLLESGSLTYPNMHRIMNVSDSCP